MATVTNTIKLPDGTAPTHAAAEIELVASTTSRAAGWVTATDVTVLSISRPAVTAGAWSASLTPNADITPSGTVYKVTEYADRHRYIHYIEVGSGGGSVFDLLVDAPASLAPAASEVYTDAAVAAHQLDTSDAHDASAISVLDSEGNFAGADVEAVLAELHNDMQPLAAHLTTISPTVPASAALTPVWAAARRRPAVTGALSACFIGDSITAGNSNFNSPLWAWDDTSYPTYLLHASDGRIVGVRNSGHGGETTTQLLARIDAEVIAYAPDVCFVQGGTNDGLGASATTDANVRSMCNKLLDAGILPILVGGPPRGSANSANRQNAADTLRVYQQIASDYSLPFVDIYRTFVATDGSGLMGATYDADGTHLTAAGYKLMADTVWSAISNMFTASAYSQYDNADSGSVLSNGMFLSGSSSVPTGWTSASGATRATGVSGVAGYALTVTSAGGAKNAQSPTTTALTAGDVYRLSFRIGTSGTTTATRAYLFHQTTSPRYRVTVDLDVKTVALEWTVGTSEAAPYFLCGVADAGSVTIGQLYMRKVS